MKSMLVLFASIMFLTACELQQDPLTGASDQVRQGVPPATGKPVAAKPLPKEALQIDTPLLVNGRVGQPVEFKITGRVMTGDDQPFTITIDNLADFPGATYDAATGDFKWTPTKAAVGSFPSMELSLRITLATEITPKSPTISIERKTISLVIVNSYSKPIINTVTGPSTLIGGQRHTFDFTMEDIDALSVQDVSVMARDCAGSYNDSIGHLVEVKDIKATTTPNKYEGKAILDLQNSALSSTLVSGSYCFTLAAVSKHGVVSDLYKRDFYIDALLKKSRLSMELAPVLVKGEKMRIAFSIFDPTGNAEVSLKSMDDLAAQLPGSSLACKSDWGSRFQLNCQGLIDTTGASVVEKVYTFNIVTETTASRSTQKVMTDHVLRVNVKAAP
ncbi:hypothetical protein QJS83_06970 [Bdellovibrio sp. 22V]|uniref:hypothetical protein n=1 Tax=Bdellovibrio TaxID=958 RepID=UPI002543C860|nr:hypothetical protein [Bdellovibrio sp. 22V]WII73613.1 hypothetical protein QJS83_06970 [Bdellovibrio sp. 22V]